MAGLFNFPPFDETGSTGFLDPALAYQAQASLLGQQGAPQQRPGMNFGSGSSIWPTLMGLGAGIAAGGAPGGGGWGGGIGKGLMGGATLANQQRETELQQKLLALKFAEAGRPDVKEITLPDGRKVSASVSGSTASPLNTSAFGSAQAPQFSIGDTKERAGVEAGLRKEYSGLSGDFIKVRDSYAKIQSATKDPSPAGDIATVFNFMRLLDPGSTVREGEYATAQNAAAVPDRIRNTYNMILAGTKLTPDQRADFTNQAKGLFSAQERQQNQLSKQFRDIATRIGVDPNNIIPDLSLVEEASSGASKGDAIQTNQNIPEARQTPMFKSESELEMHAQAQGWAEPRPVVINGVEYTWVPPGWQGGQ